MTNNQTGEPHFHYRLLCIANRWYNSLRCYFGRKITKILQLGESEPAEFLPEEEFYQKKKKNEIFKKHSKSLRRSTIMRKKLLLKNRVARKKISTSFYA